MEPAEILKSLLNEVAAATEVHRLANEAFPAVMKDIPSGLPHPDGVDRMANASTECAHAREKMRVARTRLQMFQTYGFIPKDLK
jgi:hypothetical protein